MDNEEKIIKEGLRRLPKDIQQAIISVDFEKNLQLISKKHQLHVDQTGVLEIETLRIMLGAQHPKDYIRNVAKKLNINTDQAKKIAVDVNKEIFRPIRDSLKKIHEISAAGEEPGKEQTEEYVSKPTPQKQESETREIREARVSTEKPAPQVPEEHPILRLKKNIAPSPSSHLQKQNLGWPVRLSDEKPKKAVAEQNLDKKDSLVEKQEPLVARQLNKEEIRRNTHKQKAEVHNVPVRPGPEKKAKSEWIPKQPDKSAPSPENLPVEGAYGKAPPVASYPRPERTSSLETSSKKIAEKTTEIKAPRDAVGTDSVKEKLSGSFRLPRTETEYKEAPKKDSYASGDPYREPID